MQISSCACYKPLKTGKPMCEPTQHDRKLGKQRLLPDAFAILSTVFYIIYILAFYINSLLSIDFKRSSVVFFFFFPLCFFSVLSLLLLLEILSKQNTMFWVAQPKFNCPFAELPNFLFSAKTIYYHAGSLELKGFSGTNCPPPKLGFSCLFKE